MREHSWNAEGAFEIEPPTDIDERYHNWLASLSTEDFLAAMDVELSGGYVSYEECESLLDELRRSQRANGRHGG